MLEIKPYERKFLPKDWQLQGVEDLQPFAEQLLAHPVSTLQEYQDFIAKEDEFSRAAEHEFRVRDFHAGQNLADPDADKLLQDFNGHIRPYLDKLKNTLTPKIADSVFADQIKEEGFSLMLRNLRSKAKIFQEENVALDVKDAQFKSASRKIRSALIVNLDDQELTMQAASARLASHDRTQREKTWKAIQKTRQDNSRDFDKVFSDMVQVRHQTALNAGFGNFVDYKFIQLNRHDYKPAECMKYHEAVEKVIIPAIAGFQKQTAQTLGVQKLRPWDLNVNVHEPQLDALFVDQDDLLQKAMKGLEGIDPFFADVIRAMHKENYLDLMARKHKNSGAYARLLCERKLPVMMANMTGRVEDLKTFFHETGHAVHGVLMQDLRLLEYTKYPMEIAELASMSMEYIGMDGWDRFYADPASCARAKADFLKDSLGRLAWVAQIDAFQHEVYAKPDAGPEERHIMWQSVQQRFATGMVDWTGYEDMQKIGWQDQLHIFMHPLYYIEYGVSRAGGMGIWRNYKQDKGSALQQYKDALTLGYTRSVPEIYESAGTKFDFSVNMMQDVTDFIMGEIQTLERSCLPG